MTPHKDPAKLPVNDQLQLLRDDIEEVKWDTSSIKMKLGSHDDQFKLLRSDTKELKKRFDRQDKKFEKLYNMISKFVGRIKSQDDEIGAINARVSRLEEPIQAVIS